MNSFLAFSQSKAENISKILNTGDGLSLQTAYKVESINEEYEILNYLGLKVIMQKLVVKNGAFYDVMSTNGKTIYFKIVTRKKEVKVPLMI